MTPEVAELLQAWTPILSVAFAPLMTLIIEQVKKRKIDPLVALAGLSIVLGVAWTAFLQLPTHIISTILGFAVSAGMTSSFIYNKFLKK